MSYNVLHEPQNTPLSWCVYKVLPGYEREMSHIGRAPADHVYVAGFRTQGEAESYVRALKVMA